jgi:hypothetical protein
VTGTDLHRWRRLSLTVSPGGEGFGGLGTASATERTLPFYSRMGRVVEHFYGQESRRRLQQSRSPRAEKEKAGPASVGPHTSERTTTVRALTDSAAPWCR